MHFSVRRLAGRVAAIACAALSGVAAAADSSDNLVYVIPIHDMIERGLVYVVRRGVEEAVERNASAIVFDMDTPGGRLDAAEEIINIIANVKVPTYTFVNPSAISAGAIIAMGTDHIYMAPGSRIGDAMPIMMSPFGQVQEMSEALEEKSVSYVASLIRSTAERKGHDPLLAEAMVRRKQELKIGDEVIKRAGELLTLTSKEAEKTVKRGEKEESLLSSGTASNLDDLLEKLGLGTRRRQMFEVTAAERIARYIEMLSFLFLLGGILGLYIEFKTPGFGLPGIAGIVLLAIWFWGHNIAGLAGWGEVLLFALGLALLIAEIFFFPGFGSIGAAGLICMVAAIFMAMVERYPGGPFIPPMPDVRHAAITLGFTLMAAVAVGYALAKVLPSTPVYSQLVLGTQEKREKGFEPSSSGLASLAGARGIAITDLRPSGVAEFGDRRMDVISTGGYIDKGSTVRVADVKGNRVMVERDADVTVA
jgi:membrane-bound serine protease (ClpP class)